MTRPAMTQAGRWLSGCGLFLFLSPLGDDRRRLGNAHFPCQPHQRHQADDPVADVDLPPSQAMARRCGERMVIVVPAFAEAQNAEYEIVPALIAAAERACAP